MDTDDTDVDADDRTVLISKAAMCTASCVDSVTCSAGPSKHQRRSVNARPCVWMVNRTLFPVKTQMF